MLMITLIGAPGPSPIMVPPLGIDIVPPRPIIICIIGIPPAGDGLLARWPAAAPQAAAPACARLGAAAGRMVGVVRLLRERAGRRDDQRCRDRRERCLVHGDDPLIASWSRDWPACC
jgi:hypothetical protein